MFRRVFERVVEACIAVGLVGGEGFAVDASLIVADANKQRSIPGAEWKTTCVGETARRAADVSDYRGFRRVRAQYDPPTSPRRALESHGSGEAAWQAQTFAGRQGHVGGCAGMRRWRRHCATGSAGNAGRSPFQKRKRSRMSTSKTWWPRTTPFLRGSLQRGREPEGGAIGGSLAPPPIALTARRRLA